MKLKLSKFHLFLIIIVVILASTLGFSVKEYFEHNSKNSINNMKERKTDLNNRNMALSEGSNYDPFVNDPLMDTDYTKTISGLEDIIVPGRGTKNDIDLDEEDIRTAKKAGIDMSKYILKSKVVPPVCPKCPDTRACPRQKPCPACPPCARCPEPAFECKKVPNYNAINLNNANVLPMPRLNSFAQFN